MSRDKYFNFLSDLVKGTKYRILLKRLYYIDFYSIIPNDNNRAEDGKKLRDIFEDREGITPSFSPEKTCTVLELLIGIAYRMEDALFGNHFEKSMSECFWILIDNIGLSEANDRNYCQEAVDGIIQMFIDRTYDRNGVGGIFPMNESPQDQRKVEIWYQMNSWLMANYEF